MSDAQREARLSIAGLLKPSQSAQKDLAAVAGQLTLSGARAFFAGALQVTSVPALWVLGFATACMFSICAATGIRFGLWREFGQLSAMSAGLFVLAAVLVAIDMRQLASAVSAYVVLTMTGAVSPLVNALVATTAAPLADWWLIMIDEALGFRWVPFVQWFQSWPALNKVLCYSYASLFYQPMLLILILSLVRPPCVVRFVSALSVSLAISMAIFPFAPAVDGYIYFGLKAVDFPGVEVATAWHHLEVLNRARNGLLTVLDLSSIEGIITFPSFHASAAIVCGWFWWKVPYVRYPAAVLNLVMLVSTIPVGGHYLIDVVGGTAVALASIWFAGRDAARREAGVTRLIKP
jgi:membrane-associated phospholipid phosphatase